MNGRKLHSERIDAIEKTMGSAEDALPALKPKGARLAFVDGLRGFAALWVMAYHALYFGLPKIAENPPWYCLGFTAGHLGVPMFLVISGFSLAYQRGNATGAMSQKELAGFARKRFVRIVPPYWIIVLLCASLSLLQNRVGLLGVHTVQKETDAADILWHLGLVQNLSSDHFARINGALWTVALECQLYTIFPLLLLAFKKPAQILEFGAIVSILWWIVGSALKLPAASPNPLVFWMAPPSALVVFSLGIWCAGRDREGRVQPQLFGTVGAACLVLACLLDPLGPTLPMASVILCALGAACIIRSGSESWVARVFGWKPLAKVGFVSYTLYLIHNPLVSFFGKFAQRKLDTPETAISLVIVCLLIVGLAFLLFPILEAPFHRLAKKGLGSPAK